MADDFSRIATPVKQENAEWKRVWLIVRIARIIPVKNLMETSNIIGTTFREIIEENGRDTELHGIITDYIQNEVISFQLLGKYNSVDVKYSLEKSGETTRLTQIANIHFKSILRIMSVIMWPLLKKKIIAQSHREFIKLRDLCEQETLK